MKDMIKITGINLVKFAQKVYELSRPQGLGIMHYRKGGLSYKEARELVDSFKLKGFDDPGRIALSMDYVHGRACKMVVFREDNDLWIKPVWFDHSDSQLKILLAEFEL